MVFTWRLQRILDLKETVERVEEAALLRLTDQLGAARMLYLLQKRELREKLTTIAEAGPRERIARQQFFLKHVVHDDERLRQQAAKIARLEAAHKAKIAELAEIKQAREGMEKLRAEAKRQFDLEQEKLQQKEYDDLTSSTFVHRRRGAV